jgi:hypothetical protein
MRSLLDTMNIAVATLRPANHQSATSRRVDGRRRVQPGADSLGVRHRHGARRLSLVSGRPALARAIIRVAVPQGPAGRHQVSPLRAEKVSDDCGLYGRCYAAAPGRGLPEVREVLLRTRHLAEGITALLKAADG